MQLSDGLQACIRASREIYQYTIVCCRPVLELAERYASMQLSDGLQACIRASRDIPVCNCLIGRQA